jgi:Lrp/AsnC family leucine-responsive transcriptional regulator
MSSHCVRPRDVLLGLGCAADGATRQVAEIARPNRARGMLDKIDHEIIRHLRADARLSYAALAEAVHLSQNATAERVKRLIRSGVLAGFHAVVDMATLGRPLLAYISVGVAPGEPSLEFEKVARALSGIVEIVTVTGSFDYQLKVACRDEADLSDHLVRIRNAEGVDRTSTQLILGEKTL